MKPTFTTKAALLGSTTLISLLFVINPAYSLEDVVVSDTYELAAKQSCLPPVKSMADGQAISVVECAESCSSFQGCLAMAFSEFRLLCHVFNVTFQQPFSGCGANDDDWDLWNMYQISSPPVVLTVTPGQPDKSTTLPLPMCQNGGQLQTDGTCVCTGGFVGAYCERLMQDCHEGKDSGYYPHLGSAQLILMAKPSMSPHNITVLCKADGSTYLLRQNKKNDKALNFTWDDYVSGFSIPTLVGGYWMGLQNMYYFTNSDSYQLLVNLRHTNKSGYFWRYGSFVITDNETYTASLGAFNNGPDGTDLMGDMDGVPFTTFDHHYGNTTNQACALRKGGGWWYNGCVATYNFVGSLVTGVYQPGEQYVQYGPFSPGNIYSITIALRKP